MGDNFWDRFWFIIMIVLGSALCALREFDKDTAMPKIDRRRRMLYGGLSSVFFGLLAGEFLDYFTNFNSSLIAACCGLVSYLGAEIFSDLIIKLLNKEIDKR